VRHATARVVYGRAKAPLPDLQRDPPFLPLGARFLPAVWVSGTLEQPQRSASPARFAPFVPVSVADSDCFDAVSTGNTYRYLAADPVIGHRIGALRWQLAGRDTIFLHMRYTTLPDGFCNQEWGDSMRKKTIAANLKRVLLDDAPFAIALFDYELREHIEEYLESKRVDHDQYFFAVTEHTNDVAMLLIDEQDGIHINEDARAMLRTLWRDAYAHNIELLIPKMVQDLQTGYLSTAGVQVVENAATQAHKGDAQ